jgi:hypothetical protein
VSRRFDRGTEGSTRPIHTYIASGGLGKNQKAERTSQQTQEILHRDFVPAIVDFDVLAVEVECVAAVCKYAAGEVVARIAGRIIGKHKDDV